MHSSKVSLGIEVDLLPFERMMFAGWLCVTFSFEGPVANAFIPVVPFILFIYVFITKSMNRKGSQNKREF